MIATECMCVLREAAARAQRPLRAAATGSRFEQSLRAAATHSRYEQPLRRSVAVVLRWAVRAPRLLSLTAAN